GPALSLEREGRLHRTYGAVTVGVERRPLRVREMELARADVPVVVLVDALESLPRARVAVAELAERAGVAGELVARELLIAVQVQGIEERALDLDPRQAPVLVSIVAIGIDAVQQPRQVAVALHARSRRHGLRRGRVHLERARRFRGAGELD